MPDAIFEFEQRLEPFIEGFDRLAAAAVDRLAAAASIKLSAGQAAAMGLVAWLNRLATRFVFRATLILWAHEAAAGPFSVGRVFDPLGDMVAVVAAIGRDVGAVADSSSLRSTARFGRNSGGPCRFFPPLLT